MLKTFPRQVDTLGNNRFGDVFPNTTRVLIGYLMTEIFGNLEYNIFQGLTADLYKTYAANDNVLGNYDYEDYGIGGALHRQIKTNIEADYLDTGKYRTAIADALQDIAAYDGDSDNHDDFETFVDTVYVDYNMESLFFNTFDDVFMQVQDQVISYGVDAWETSDIPDVTTAYMR